MTPLRLRLFYGLTQRKRQIVTVSISYYLHKSNKTDVVPVYKTQSPKSSGRTILPLIYPFIFPLYHFCPEMTHSLCQKLSGSKPLSYNTFNVPVRSQSQTDSAPSMCTHTYLLPSIKNRASFSADSQVFMQMLLSIMLIIIHITILLAIGMTMTVM